MPDPEVQEQEAPTRPLRMQFMADQELFDWAERRRRALDVSASAFLYEIVAKAKAADEAAA